MEVKVSKRTLNVKRYLSKAYDSIGVVVGRDDHCHLTPEADLSSASGVLQPHAEVLHLLRNVIVDDVNGDLQLAVARSEPQFAVAESGMERREVRGQRRSDFWLCRKEVKCR